MGLAGDDTLYAQAGNDIIDGGSGEDWLYGGEGDDLLKGGTQNDALSGDDGNDILDGGAGNDALNGGANNDTYLFGKGSGKDSINDQDLTVGKLDVIQFGAGVFAADVLLQRDGDTLVLAINGTGDTLRVYKYFTNEATSGYQVEQIKFADGTTWDIAGVKAKMLAAPNNEDSTLYGYATADTLTGLAGDDILYAQAGNDTLAGGKGEDSCTAKAGMISLMEGSKTIF